MNLISRFWVALGLIFLIGPSVAGVERPADDVAANNLPSYQLAILAYRSKLSTFERWKPLVNYLQQNLPQVRFTLAVYHLDELEHAVSTNQVDFVLTQPSHYVLLSYQKGLTSPLAMLENKEGAFATDRFGGVVFTRHQRNDINDWQQLKGKKVAAAAYTSLGAFQMQAFEMLQYGIDLPDIELIETGQPKRLVLESD